MAQMIRQLVHIRWRDSKGCHSNWQPLEDLNGEAIRDCIVDSVGFIIRETDTAIHIAPHIHIDGDEGEGVYCGDMQIPKAMIIEEWEIT